MIEASCHCGSVRLEISEKPKSVTECNCSICRRLGVQWAYYHPDEVKIICPDDATVIYMWNDREIEFHHCRTCGCVTHYEGLGERPRRAVNARLIEIENIKGVPVRHFDGASS
jgi:hypothetical protein